ncbi:hypothetical protein JB92DRAFT_2800349 [Gautieria morchelliformis]|nr:hypothetical protein JB92DRAFT_2800349 [Gautieria morchelliformis]
MPSKGKSDSHALPTARSASPKQLQERFRRDARFNPPPPSTWKRVALVVLVVFLFWLAFRMRLQQRKPQIIHADRYSREHKYRPAASPIITETLKDGRIRLRGANL